MTGSVVQDSPLKPLLDRVMAARQLGDIRLGRQLLSLFLTDTSIGHGMASKSIVRLAFPPAGNTGRGSCNRQDRS